MGVFFTHSVITRLGHLWVVAASNGAIPAVAACKALRTQMKDPGRRHKTLPKHARHE